MQSKTYLCTLCECLGFCFDLFTAEEGTMVLFLYIGINCISPQRLMGESKLQPCSSVLVV
jgi:hypothetical protein